MLALAVKVAKSLRNLFSWLPTAINETDVYEDATIDAFIIVQRPYEVSTPLNTDALVHKPANFSSFSQSTASNARFDFRHHSNGRD